MLMGLIKGHYADPIKVTPGMIVAGVLVWLALVVAFLWYAISRIRRSEAIVRSALEQAGYEALRIQYRYLSLGPFSLWDTSRTHDVFRVRVRDRANAAQTTVWARYGRTWYTSPTKLEFRSDDPAAAARLRANVAIQV